MSFGILALGMGMNARRAAAVAATPFDYPAFLNGRSGAAYDVSRTSTLYSDTAGTTPAVVDGLVGKILDLSGGNFHLIAFSNALRGTLRTSGGKYWIEGPFCYQAAGLTLGSPATNTTPWQRMTGMRQTGWTSGRRIWAAKTAGGGGFLYQNGTTPSLANYDNGTNNALINPGMALNVAAIIEEYHAGNTNSYNKVATNANFTTGVGFVGTALCAGLSLGGDPDGTANAAMDFFGAVVCNGTWSAGEKTTLYTQILSLLTPIPAVTDQASLIAAVAMSPSGTTISIPAGEYGPLDLGSGASRSRTATITLAAADTANKPTFTGTANGAGLKINSWNGMTLDGLIVKHDEASMNATLVTVLDLDTSTNCVVTNCYVHGNTGNTAHIGSGGSPTSLRGIGLNNSTGAQVTKTKVSHVSTGIYATSATGTTVTNNYFISLQEDGIRADTGCSSWTVEQNIYDSPTPTYTGNPVNPYDDHCDFIQCFTTTGNLSTFSIQNNFVRFTTDHARGNGIFVDNEGVGTYSNFTIKTNIVAGASNAIFLASANGSGNLVEANEVYVQSTSTEVTSSTIRFAGSTVTYKNNQGTLDTSSGDNTLTNGNTGSQGPTTTITPAAIQTKLDTFRALYPLIPT
jgi:hypothetical protein